MPQFQHIIHVPAGCVGVIELEWVGEIFQDQWNFGFFLQKRIERGDINITQLFFPHGQCFPAAAVKQPKMI